MYQISVCFVSNYINHHQIPFCNALYELTGGKFVFVQTKPMEEERIQMGWHAEDRPQYVKCSYTSSEDMEECKRIIKDADVVIFGGVEDESFIAERLASGKVIFRNWERLYREGQWKAISPRGLIKKYHDHTRYRKSNVYLLCSGAYVASDFNIIRAYPGKKLCWGYFPETKHYDIDTLMANKGYIKDGKRVPYILWTARLIELKHPEMAIKAAYRLKSEGIEFHMDLAGGGAMEQQLQEMIKDYGLEDCVDMLGFQSPENVRVLMEKADIFLFTSNRLEGWGAVVNESMNSGCAIVADHLIGSVPYLVKHEVNGLVYRDGDDEMFYSFVKRLVLDRATTQNMGRKSYQSIVNTWNPENAAAKFMEVASKILAKGQDAVIDMTPDIDNLYPCAAAPLINEKYKY